jgi:indoleamine 2,3-dioxygenase
VLTFILHFYVHSRPSPVEHAGPLPIPASISVPLFAICPLLGLPPILTYADTVLYNCLPDEVNLPFQILTNPPTRMIESFTNTPSEDHFYLTSAKCEMYGVRALSTMRAMLQLAAEPIFSNANAARLSDLLLALAFEIDLVGRTIVSVQDGCDPATFFHQIRPWFRGGDASGAGSQGWAFLGLTDAISLESAENPTDPSTKQLNGSNGRLKLSGTSAGQSSLIHSFDVFLDIDHMPHRPQTTAISPSEASSDATFLSRMKHYMPGPHRAFLSSLASTPMPIRKFVLNHASRYPALRMAYDEAVDRLQILRERHMRIVSLYIIQQARGRPPGGRGPPTGQLIEELRGTGGSALFKFLKLNRDNTKRAKITA